ncbi:hypothetical protein LTS15_006973 [Exophiala xenobiotica]|nr:hypothetical protein LTS15_006973 [Exophiala xenobiotica]
MENEFDELLSSGNLDETYEKLLTRASKRYPELARTILGIVVASRRPLTVGEMSTAISIKTGSNSSHHLKDVLPDPELSTKNICGLLADLEAIIQHCVRRHDFLKYASMYWTYHFRWSQFYNNDTITTLHKLARQLIDTQSKPFLTWFQIYWTGES